jgi:hypothetical protein
MAKNIPIFSISRPFKNYPNLDFWFENKPSGNPALRFGFQLLKYFLCLNSIFGFGG